MPKMRMIESVKTGDLRLLELLQALQVIRDCLLAVESGKQYAILPVGGQLRALLSEKSRTNRALLYDLAQIANVKPELYIRKPVELPFDEDLVLHLPGLNASLSQDGSLQEKVSIEEFLDARIAKVGEHYYTVSDIIDFAANKSGGAHYATKVAPQLWRDMTFPVPVINVPIWQWALKDIGQAALQFGVSLLHRIGNLSVHFGFVLREMPERSNCCIFVASDYTGSVIWSFALGSNEPLSFRVVGLCGTECAAKSNGIIDWNSPKHVCGLVNIREDLSTEVSLYVNSNLVGRSQHTAPLLVLSAMRGHRLEVNLPQADHSGCGFAMFDFRVYSNYFENEEKHDLLADHYRELANNHDGGCLYLGPNARGTCSGSETDLHLTGHEWTTISEVLAKPIL